MKSQLPEFAQTLPLASYYDAQILGNEVQRLQTTIDRGTIEVPSFDADRQAWNAATNLNDEHRRASAEVARAKHLGGALDALIEARANLEQAQANDAATREQRAKLETEQAQCISTLESLRAMAETAQNEWVLGLAAERRVGAKADPSLRKKLDQILGEQTGQEAVLASVLNDMDALPTSATAEASAAYKAACQAFAGACTYCADHALAQALAKRLASEFGGATLETIVQSNQLAKLTHRLALIERDAIMTVP